MGANISQLRAITNGNFAEHRNAIDSNDEDKAKEETEDEEDLLNVEVMMYKWRGLQFQEEYAIVYTLLDDGSTCLIRISSSRDKVYFSLHIMNRANEHASMSMEYIAERNNGLYNLMFQSYKCWGEMEQVMDGSIFHSSIHKSKQSHLRIMRECENEIVLEHKRFVRSFNQFKGDYGDSLKVCVNITCDKNRGLSVKLDGPIRSSGNLLVCSMVTGKLPDTILRHLTSRVEDGTSCSKKGNSPGISTTFLARGLINNSSSNTQGNLNGSVVNNFRNCNFS